MSSADAPPSPPPRRVSHSQRSHTPQQSRRSSALGLRRRDTKDSHGAGGLSKKASENLKNLQHEKLAAARNSYGPGVIPYLPEEPIKNLLRWNGTIVQKIITRRTEMYAYLTVYVVCFVLSRQPGMEGLLPKIDYEVVRVPATLLVFLTVFYNGTQFSRFLTQFHTSKNIAHEIETSITLLKAVVTRDDFYELVEVSRLLNATHSLCYLNLNDEYKEVQDWKPFCVETHRLLSISEAEYLTMYDGRTMCAITVGWVQGIVANLRKQDKMDPQMNRSLQDAMRRIKMSINTLYDFQEMPVPFIYYHFLQLFLTTFLFIFSYFAVFMSGSFGWLTCIVTIFGFLGLREVSIQLADPFGSDDTDLPVLQYLLDMIDLSRNILMDVGGYVPGVSSDFLLKEEL